MDVIILKAGNITEVWPVYVHYLSWQESLFLVTLSVVCLLNLVACVFICHAILKYEKLNSQVRNQYILHWHVMVGFHHIFTPNLLTILMANVVFSFNSQVYVVMLQIQTSLSFCSMIMVAILAADSMASAYFEDIWEKFRARCKLTITSVYAILATCIVLFSCLNVFLDIIPMGHAATFFGYVSLFLITAIFNAIHLVKRNSVALADETTLGLKISNVFVACWLPSLLSLLVGIFAYYPANIWFSVTGAYLAYCNPIINIYLLMRWDRQFRECFSNMLRCSCKYDGNLENHGGRTKGEVIWYCPDGVYVNK